MHHKLFGVNPDQKLAGLGKTQGVKVDEGLDVHHAWLHDLDPRPQLCFRVIFKDPYIIIPKIRTMAEETKIFSQVPNVVIGYHLLVFPKLIRQLD